MKLFLTISIFCIAVVPVSAQWQTSHIRKANRLYKEKKFELAVPEYVKSVGEGGAEPVNTYNLGNAYFRMGKFDNAISAFEKSEEAANTAALKENSYYNKGVSYSRQNKIEESIAAYKSALIINPADSDARVNLQKALLERKKKETPKQENKNDQKNKDQKKNKEKDQPPQSKMTKKEVEQLLKALQQREQQVQQKMQQTRTRATNKPDQDW